ncbi:hypothetical protein FF098_001410 [Parvularcula flava]|uniref:Transmembrane protein n=1 Tax=Aquisalinus luteolus TaxID=1566827 RepID=A0A8J3A0F7_9PROT|nr:hypothetical protein [Aquisalinus luteolus]NHK26561.1 hypothetical protein [Aquisalinus luteolus]GGH92710.1 hypothetical protein GCM10011355_02850 [Aquisalinus luteolus]
MADNNDKKTEIAEGAVEDRRYRAQSTDEAAEQLDRDAAESDSGQGHTGHDDFLSARDARATGEHYRMTPEEEKSRKRRSIAIALGIVAFVVLIYLITMLRLAENVGG